MNIPHFTLPKPVGALFALLPQRPHSVLFTTVLNVALSRHLKPQDFHPLHGKHIRIRVTDARVALDFGVTPNSFVAMPPVSQPDLTISASAYDFLMLGLRKEDPDTLFFSRRLTMEGDTELGLFVKNTLDTLELPPLDFSRFLPPILFASLPANPSRSPTRTT